MKQRIIALLLALCLVLQAVPVFAGAAEGQKVSAGSVTITAGKTATVTLKAENFQNIASLEVFVYYDPLALTLSSTSNGTKLSGAAAEINKNEPGTVRLNAISLDGISGTGNLLTLNFTTTEDCTPGTYPITVAIGEVYDTGLGTPSISGVSGSVTVNGRPATVEAYNIYVYPDKTTLQKGDVLSFRVACGAYPPKPFVSGDFIVDYDSELFAFDSLVLEKELTGEGAFYTINSNISGQIRLIYTNVNPVEEFYLFRVNLKVIGDIDGKTSFTVQSSNVYREDLTAYGPGKTSQNITLQKLPVVEDHSDVFLKSEKMVVGQQSKSTLWLEAKSGVAAANFTVSYDPDVLRCVDVKMAEQPEGHDVLIVTNDNFTEGIVRFSYINMDGVESRDVPMVDITWEPIKSPATHIELVTGGSDVENLNWQEVPLEYKNDTRCIFVATVQPATCQKEGLITYRCGCGVGDTPQVLPVLSKEECIHYTVRFADHDGTEISTEEYHLGDTVSVPEDPTREADDTYTYTFAGWDKEVTDCQGNVTYTATYTATEIKVEPKITLTSASLAFEDEVFYNLYCYATGWDVDVSQMGMLIWYERPAEGKDKYEDADAVVEGAIVDGNRYKVRSRGVAAKNLADKQYLRVYARLEDGTYVYSSMTWYSAKYYAEDRLKNSNSAELKALCVAMLNYGAAAQEYFKATGNYTYTSLMNADLTEEQRGYVAAYSSDMITALRFASADKARSLTKTEGGFTKGTASVSFEGALSFNYYLTPGHAVDGDMTLYCWTQNRYDSVDELTLENCTSKKTMKTVENGRYWAKYEGIVAKRIDETVYLCAVYESGGEIYRSGVLSYSLGYYCQDRIANGSEAMKALAKATAVYGYYAKIYFANRK